MRDFFFQYDHDEGFFFHVGVMPMQNPRNETRQRNSVEFMTGTMALYQIAEICCLRCAKQLAYSDFDSCNKPSKFKCWRCKGGKKGCLPVSTDKSPTRHGADAFLRFRRRPSTGSWRRAAIYPPRTRRDIALLARLLSSALPIGPRRQKPASVKQNVMDSPTDRAGEVVEFSKKQGTHLVTPARFLP